MKIKLNQEIVIVTIGNNARYGTHIYKATVSKIGRKWFEVNTEVYLGNYNKFSLENGKCDGGNYMSEWQAFESEEIYKEALGKPNIRREIEKNLYGLTYKQLSTILKLIEDENVFNNYVEQLNKPQIPNTCYCGNGERVDGEHYCINCIKNNPFLTA